MSRGVIEALTGQRLAVVSPVGMERMPTEALSRAVQERWRLVKRRAEPIESVADLPDALHMMYGSWSDFCAQVRTAFHGRTVPGIVGSCVVKSRAFANQIGGWDARVQAADWDLYLRLAQRAREQGDVAPPMVAGWVYVHHYVQATRRGERAPFTCTHPRLTVQEKWGEAAIRRWFFDPPLLCASATARSAGGVPWGPCAPDRQRPPQNHRRHQDAHAEIPRSRWPAGRRRGRKGAPLKRSKAMPARSCVRRRVPSLEC